MKDKKNEYKSDLDILKIMASAKEFEVIKVRGEEFQEIKRILKEGWVFDQQLDLGTKQLSMKDKNITQEAIIENKEKIIALISAYLGKIKFENFSLVSDSQFIVQNSIRLFRCMLEMCMKKNMAFNVEVILRCCKLLENRMVPGENPLHQFCKENFFGYNSFKLRKENREGFLSSELIERLEEKEFFIEEI